MSLVWIFTAWRAGISRPAKAMTTPAPTMAGEAAAVIASRRLRGPSDRPFPAARWAPVKTTGLSAEATRSTRKATSSITSVPWATTMPSTCGRPCDSTTAAATAAMSEKLIASDRPLWTRHTRTGGAPSGSSPTRRSSASLAARAPSALGREVIVPPAPSNRMWPMPNLRSFVRKSACGAPAACRIFCMTI